MTRRAQIQAAAAILIALQAGPSLAADTNLLFADGAKDAKVHAASGFVCPLKIGEFERDAVGQSDPDAQADFCAYSARDGVYGTVTLKPLSSAYDAKASLTDAFAVQEGSRGKMVSEGTVKVTGGTPFEIFSRSYETSALEDLHYRVQFTGAAVGNWAVETTIEYAEPRDNADAREFLDTVYRAATAEIAANAVASPAHPPPVASGPAPR